MHWFASSPVGLPGLAVIALGITLFFASLLLANTRSKPETGKAIRARRSWIGVVIQGIAIGIVGTGPIRIVLDPLSAAALAEAALVAVLMAAVLWLFIGSSRSMGKNWALVARTRSDHELVTSGPFALARHPIYLALFCFMLALAAAYGHWQQLIIGVPLFALGTWIRVGDEERLLRAQFGPAYDAYAARVKRFVPRLF